MMQTKVMIVDDEPITRMDLKEMLEEHGFDVVGEGRNGEEAIEKARLLQPDLIIMDVKMSQMNGIKASTIIKRFSDCAILLLTAYSHKELVEDAKKAGINSYLVKPVQERELLPAVEIALSQRVQFLALQEKITSLEQKMAERKMIERAKGIVMQRFNYTEDQAYRYMQKKSMNSHMTLGRVAETIMKLTSV